MSNILLKLIKFGIGFVFFIPLYIGGSFFFPFIFPKIWLFQLTIEMIFFLYIILAVSDVCFRPKFNWVLKAIILLTLVLIITSFTGVDVFRSFWGNTERMSGVIAWFHFVAFTVILSSVLKTEKEWKNFFGIAVAVSILEFFYVLAQYFGAAWVWMPHSQIGTIGNADLLGSYAIFSAFFSLYLCQNDLKFKKFWIIAFFLNVATLYFAGSRGAMLGFASGIFIYILVSIWNNPRVLKIWGAVLAILILSYFILFLFRNTDFIMNNYQLGRITNISFQDRTIQQRFTEWGIAWDAFKSRPILGFGPNNYLYLHNAFLNPKVYNLQETNFDRAHNAYLDYASMSGIVGLLGYVFLIAILFWAFCPPTRDLPKGEKTQLFAFASLIIAYAVQSFFVFDSPASFIALFLTTGFASYKIVNPNNQIPNPKQTSNFKPQTILAISIFYFLFSIFLIYQVSVKPAVANYEFVRAFNDPSLSPEESFNLYKKALSSETLGTTEFRNQYIGWLQKNIMNFKPENRLEIIDFGISQLEKEVKDHPLVFTYLNLGQLYDLKGRGIQDQVAKQELFKKSAGAYDRALELSPKRLEVYVSYLQASFDMKDYNKGIEIMKRAVEAVPDYPSSHWYLGLAYTASGVHDNEAVDSINKALVLWYRNNVFEENGRLKYDLGKILNSKNSFVPKQEILGAVNPYIRLKMWPELLLLYLSAEAGNPNDIEIHKSLALVYQNLGLNDKVKEELAIINNLEKK